MKKFSHIYYTDAYYLLEEVENLETKIPHNEAFGFISNGKKNALILHFIKKYNQDEKNQDPDDFVVKGLVLPRQALIQKEKKSEQKAENIKGLDDLELGQNVSITWNDVVYVENDCRNDCSIMYTDGTVCKNEPDHIVIKNPETIRTYPLPIKNHPKIKPLYYIIPKCIISQFEIINQNQTNEKFRKHYNLY